MKKVISVILVLATILVAMVSCGKDNKDTETVKETVEETNPKYIDNLPSTLDFKNEEINILTWTEKVSEDWCSMESQTSNKVDVAVYDRQSSVEDRLNVEFNITTEPGYWASRETFVQTVSGSIDSGTPYDLVAVHPSVSALATYKGYYKNLSKANYLDLTQPWWSDDIREACSFNGKVFFVTGDISTTAISSMACMILNLNMYEDLGFEEDIYEVILNREFTMEEFLKLSVGSIGDYMDGEAKALTINSYVEYDSLFAGAGFKYVKKNDNGRLTLSSDLTNERLTNWFTKCFKLLHDNDDVVLGSIETNFVDGFALWHCGYIFDISTYLTDVSFSFAIAPCPMYDSEQKEYCTLLSNLTAYYSIPKGVKNMDMSAAVMEALASKSYTDVTPIVYESAFQLRYLRSDKNAQVFDLLHDTLCFDTGRVFCDQLEKIGYAFRQAAVSETDNWTEYKATYYTPWETSLNKLMKTLLVMPD